MPESTNRPLPVEPGAYTEEYYRTAVEGHQEYAASAGRQLSARLARALQLADPRPGQRLLDIACGRGELVLQSALRGAFAVGIDYAPAALAIARECLKEDEVRQSAELVRVDAGHLAFRPGTFDVALMLDFVEHVHQPELEQALAEAHYALKPGGRLIIHTSPNRLFEEVVYRYYVRNIHRLLLKLAGPLRLPESFFNDVVLPTGPLPPHDEYERRLHVNPQSSSSLRKALQRHGFRVRRIDHWEPPPVRFFPPERRRHYLALRLLDTIRFLRPLGSVPPLNRLFSNHIWVVAERE